MRADGADVVVLAVPGEAVAEVVAALGGALAGKVVIDAANRIGQPEVDSRAAVAAAAPGAGYVRAFNALGWENFADPPAGTVLFLAADPGARTLAEELITADGLEPMFAGDADACGTVDALLPLWFALVQHNSASRRVALRITPSATLGQTLIGWTPRRNACWKLQARGRPAAAAAGASSVPY